MFHNIQMPYLFDLIFLLVDISLTILYLTKLDKSRPEFLRFVFNQRLIKIPAQLDCDQLLNVNKKCKHDIDL